MVDDGVVALALLAGLGKLVDAVREAVEISGLADAADGRQGAEVDADADGNLVFLGERDDLTHLVGVADVAGVQSDAADAALDGLKREQVMEVDVRDDGDGGAAADLLEGLCGVHVGDGGADDVTPGGGNLIYLHDGGFGIAGVRLGHGLDGDGGVTADRDVAYVDLSRNTSLRHGLFSY